MTLKFVAARHRADKDGRFDIHQIHVTGVKLPDRLWESRDERGLVDRIDSIQKCFLNILKLNYEPQGYWVKTEQENNRDNYFEYMDEHPETEVEVEKES